MIIDAHAHIMSEVNGRIGRGPTRSQTQGHIQFGANDTVRLTPPVVGKTAFPPEVLLENMDWAGVDKAVLLQGPLYGDHNQYVAKAVRRWPDRFIGAGNLDPRAADAGEAFGRLVGECNFRIVKLEMSETTGWCGIYPGLSLDEDGLAWLWAEAEKHGVVMTLDLGAVGSASYQTQQVQSLLERHPRLKIVIAHLAQPPVSCSDDARLDALWLEQVALAKHPNLWFDLSSLPFYAANDQYPFPSAMPYLKRAMELVGANKLMWGTDAPALLCYATYPQLLDYLAKHAAFLSADELQQILGGNARQVYGNAV